MVGHKKGRKWGGVFDGDVNMRGKKYRRHSCGCCETIDRRDEFAARDAEQQIRDAITPSRSPYVITLICNGET